MSLLQKVKSPIWNVSMVDIHIRKLLWVYCPGHAGVKLMTEQINWRAKQVACFSGELKC